MPLLTMLNGNSWSGRFVNSECQIGFFCRSLASGLCSFVAIEQTIECLAVRHLRLREDQVVQRATVGIDTEWTSNQSVTGVLLFRAHIRVALAHFVLGRR